MDDIVIKVDNVYKDFVLPHERAGSVKGVFTSMLREATKKKETQHALKDISFEIKKGEFFGIVGRNGSGKSTLLKILAGIYQPTKGSVQVTGKLVPFIELGVGFNPELTGKDNVYLNGAMLGFSTKEIEAMYDDIVAFAELDRFMDQKLKNYSSGMQVRLAFSMAIRSEADILVLDEVLAVGDADFQRKCFNYFKQLKKNGTTVVFVTHDMEAVREYCDRAMLIENSKLADIGNTSKIAGEYMKLFSEDTVSQKGNVANRWGNGEASIIKMDVEINKTAIVITEVIKAKHSIDSPIIGFRIRDTSGQEVLGTNSKIEHQTMPTINSGEKVKVTWELSNILADGEYIIDPAVLHSDGITVVDWWDEAKQFKVIKNRHLPYSVDPSYKLVVSKEP